jgi:hypothetical chaperone protein
MGSLIHGGKAPMPLHYYHDLATWHRINLLYTHKVQSDLKHIRFDAARPDLLDRLIKVVTKHRGHSIAMAVEAAKIDLSDHTTAMIRLADVIGEDLAASRDAFEFAVARPMERIRTSIATVLGQAGLPSSSIATVFMTGGSSSLPVLHAAVAETLPSARIATGDLLGSVGAGLALDARRRFL